MARVIDQIVPMSSTDTAELVKLLENIYRSVNIALVNELKLLCDRMGIDIWEVIDAASTKPFGFTPFYPGAWAATAFRSIRFTSRGKLGNTGLRRALSNSPERSTHRFPDSSSKRLPGD